MPIEHCGCMISEPVENGAPGEFYSKLCAPHQKQPEGKLPSTAVMPELPGIMTLWRARFLMVAFADLPDEFRTHDYSAKTRKLATQPNGASLQIMDLLLERSDLKAAFMESLDVANEIADALAFLSYAPVNFDFVSVTVPKAKIGQEFLIALIRDNHFRRNVSTISAPMMEDLLNRTENEGRSIRRP